jgi:membrane peptidoglycan carboxypeptidase
MKTIFRAIRRLLALLLCLLLLLGGVLAFEGYQMYKQALDETPLEQKLAELTAQENYTTLDELPEFYLQAVVAAEDRRFYYHNGVDIIAIARAAINDIQVGELVEGGSTITQQLAKNLYFTQEKRFERKFAEIFMARDIEQLCDKNKILELYANSIYFGSGYYCIYDAAEGYYGKTPAELSEAECAMLAGLPNAPSAYSPKTNPELAYQRQQQVLNKMVKSDMISATEAAAILP